MRARLDAGVDGVTDEAFLAANVVEGVADFVEGTWEVTLPTEGVGEAARDGGAV